MNFTKAISPACLPVNDNDQFVNASAIASGWGKLFMDGPMPVVLNYVDLSVLSNSNCGSNLNIDNYHLCATGLNKYGDLTDTCEGDSGGPLVTQVDGRWTLIGVVSYGNNCSEPSYPGVYARVTSVLDWILQETQIAPCDRAVTWTQWSEWSSYSTQVDGGQRIRTRGCVRDSLYCNGDPIEINLYKTPGAVCSFTI